MRNLTAGVQVNDKSKRVYANCGNLSEVDRAMVTALIAGGYKLYPPTKKGQSNGKKFMKKSEYLAQLSAEEKEEFNRICETEDKGFSKAVAWFNAREAK